MKTLTKLAWLLIPVVLAFSCKKEQSMKSNKSITAKEILGDSNYLAISYGGYRGVSRDKQPTIQELKNDMKILSAMGIKIIRTYNVQLDHAPNVLKAIRELRSENPNFEMPGNKGASIYYSISQFQMSN